MRGTIKRLKKAEGFGFIKAEARDGGVEYFFHRSALKNARMEDLREGQEVTFEDSEGSKGPRAEDVFV